MAKTENAEGWDYFLDLPSVTDERMTELTSKTRRLRPGVYESGSLKFRVCAETVMWMMPYGREVPIAKHDDTGFVSYKAWNGISINGKTMAEHVEEIMS